MRTVERSRTRAPLKTTLPVARNTLSSMVAPVTWQLGPTRQFIPICTACRPVARTTAFSMITQWRPIVTDPPCDVITAPCNTHVPSPMVTSPLMIAPGAMVAVGWICGRLPRCSSCMLNLRVSKAVERRDDSAAGSA
jgi:hypothetical protein